MGTIFEELIRRFNEQSNRHPHLDPAYESGGMLSIAKEHVLAQINPNADIRLFGQEVNDETYAVCGRPADQRRRPRRRQH